MDKETVKKYKSEEKGIINEKVMEIILRELRAGRGEFIFKEKK